MDDDVLLWKQKQTISSRSRSSKFTSVAKIRIHVLPKLLFEAQNLVKTRKKKHFLYYWKNFFQFLFVHLSVSNKSKKKKKKFRCFLFFFCIFLLLPPPVLCILTLNHKCWNFLFIIFFLTSFIFFYLVFFFTFYLL